MPRRLLPILILGFFLLSTGGYYPILKLEQWQAARQTRQQLRQQNNEAPVYCIGVANEQVAELEWEEDERELLYEGQMYDVKYTTVSADSTFIYVIPDVRETSVFSAINELTQKQLMKKISKLFPAVYYAETRVIVPCHLFTCRGDRQSMHCCRLLSLYPEYVPPPPEAC